MPLDKKLQTSMRAGSPAKDKLLADRENEEVASLFGRVGIAVTQDETFYVEPKKENE